MAGRVKSLENSLEEQQRLVNKKREREDEQIKNQAIKVRPEERA